MEAEIEKQLFECSILAVSTLLDAYKKNKIDITNFRRHTARKISYIKKNILYVKDSKQKKEIENLIKECVELNI